jgi:hypothetical protein
VSSIDEELRAHFDDLRAEDRARAPQFSALWHEGGSGKREAASGGLEPTGAPLSTWPGRPVWWFAAAASVVIAAMVLVQLTQRVEVASDTALSDTVLYSGIMAWTSPTDGLLRMSQRTTRTSTSLLGSVFDGVAAPAAQSDTSKGRGGL